MRTQGKRNINSNKGQLSVFMGISMLIAITVIAFVVNVGLFVKAKINLQNSVDAAAWSGASVQARQLTNIGYMNWEMRNVFKEWMFKFYVVGQLSLPQTNVNNLPPTRMNFRPRMFQPPVNNADRNYSPFNIPSVCINIGTQQNTNICEVFTVPGLPRFQTVGLPGIDEQSNSFINTLVEKKASACSRRSLLNFSTAMNWTYGQGGATAIFANTPQIAIDRPGAWPKALELALRVRNLELLVNRPPVDGISANGINGTTTTSALASEYELPFNERPMKAFLSGYRNLNPDMKSSFILTELRPTPFVADTNELSGYLIPTASPVNWSPLEKHYVDLQVLPINYAIFYTNFTTTTELGADVPQEAKCAISHTALPAPSYLLGYVKNPNVLTYYAVKGEAKHIGLFYPFDSPGGITINAYAAAKPFGGRIGPRLFNIQNRTEIVARSGGQNRSAPYASALNLSTINQYDSNASSGFALGAPIPLSTTFWAQSASDVIGGSSNTNDIKFVIPNLIYEFQSSVSELDPQVAAGSGIVPLSVATNPTNAGANNVVGVDAPNTGLESEDKGLYDSNQFRQFASNLTAQIQNLDATLLDDSIYAALKPTKYEALNYLIPTIDNQNENISSKSVVVDISQQPSRIQYRLFAPLFGNNSLYTNEASVVGIVNQFISANGQAVTAYMEALGIAASSLKSQTTTQDGGYDQAANLLHDGTTSDPNPTTFTPPTCASLAGKFGYFFQGSTYPNQTFVEEGTGNNLDCATFIKPLPIQVEEYLSNSNQNNPAFQNFYTPSYSRPNATAAQLSTAYRPGLRQGAGQDASNNKPFATVSGGNFIHTRNYYSTKLVAMDKLVGKGDVANQLPYINNFSTYSESQTLGSQPSDIDAPSFLNPIDTSAVSEFLNLDH